MPSSRSNTPSGRPVQAMSAAHALHFQIPKLPTPTPPSLLKRNASTGSSAKCRTRGASASEAVGSPKTELSNSTARRTSSPATAMTTSLPSSPSFPPVSVEPSVSVQHLSHRQRASAMSAAPLPSSSSPALSTSSSRDSDGSISPITPRTPLSPRVAPGYTSRALAAAAPTSSPRRPVVKRRDTPIYTADLSPVFPKKEEDNISLETTSTLDSEVNEFDQHFGTASTIAAAAGQ